MQPAVAGAFPVFDPWKNSRRLGVPNPFIPAGTMDNNGNRSFSNAEAGQTPNGGPISNDNPRSFTLTLTYAVPEPSTGAAVLLGAGAPLWITVKRRRACV